MCKYVAIGAEMKIIIPDEIALSIEEFSADGSGYASVLS